MTAPQDRKLTPEEVAILEKGKVDLGVEQHIREYHSAARIGLYIQYLAVAIGVVTLGGYAYSVFY